jgi:hypothetical protein
LKRQRYFCGVHKRFTAILGVNSRKENIALIEFLAYSKFGPEL